MSSMTLSSVWRSFSYIINVVLNVGGVSRASSGVGGGGEVVGSVPAERLLSPGAQAEGGDWDVKSINGAQQVQVVGVLREGGQLNTAQTNGGDPIDPSWTALYA